MAGRMRRIGHEGAHEQMDRLVKTAVMSSGEREHVIGRLAGWDQPLSGRLTNVNISMKGPVGGMDKQVTSTAILNSSR